MGYVTLDMQLETFQTQVSALLNERTTLKHLYFLNPLSLITQQMYHTPPPFSLLLLNLIVPSLHFFLKHHIHLFHSPTHFYVLHEIKRLKRRNVHKTHLEIYLEFGNSMLGRPRTDLFVCHVKNKQTSNSSPNPF